MSSDEPIIFENVCKSFGSRRVLDHQTFSVKRGELFVIIGPSGTGKSVSLKLASGQLMPTSGSVRILGQDLATLSSEELSRVRRRMGYLFQSGALLGWKTLAENVALPLREHLRLSEDDIATRVSTALAEVGLADAGELYPAEVSGGMIKRAAFARAMIEDPEVLFFDEPTSGLDPVMSRTIDGLIRDVNQRRGAACVVVTHDLSGALRYADRIAFLNGGRFVEIATPAGIVQSKNEEVKSFLEAQLVEVKNHAN